MYQSESDYLELLSNFILEADKRLVYIAQGSWNDVLISIPDHILKALRLGDWKVSWGKEHIESAYSIAFFAGFLLYAGTENALIMHHKDYYKFKGRGADWLYFRKDLPVAELTQEDENNLVEILSTNTHGFAIDLRIEDFDL